MLNGIAFSAQVAAGARWSLLLTAASAAAIALIAILSVKFGYGKFHRKDLISIIVAIIGVMIWALTSQPIIALLIVITIDIVALWLTLAKTWKAPHTETLIAWVCAAGAGILGVLAVGDYDIAKLIYPIYIALGNSLLVFEIIYRRRAIRQSK